MIELDDLFHCINHILKVFVRERIVERKAHNLRIILFCVGTKAFFISKLFVVGVPVYGKVMHLGVDAFLVQRVKKFPSAAAKELTAQPENIEMPGGVRFRDFLLHLNLGNLGKGLVIDPYNFLSAPGKRIQLF